MPSRSAALRLRRLTPADLPALHQLEAEAYSPELHESDAAFLQLMRLYPEGALGFFDADGLCGYAFATPCRSGTTLPLRTPIDMIPADADTFYIHDVAVAARCRGQAIGRRLATELLTLAAARGFTRSELVSVQGSAPFWQRFSFEPLYEFEYVPGVPSVKMARMIAPTTGFAHFTLATPDAEQTALFVDRTFGYPRKPVPPDSPVRVVWFDIGNGQEMHLLEVARFTSSPFEGEFGRHVAVRHPAHDFAALKTRVTAAGGTLIEPGRPTPFARFFFREPVNGYVFEVIEGASASHFDQ
jgi:ribosomal protein S18 acetylase RimI-like enzyme